MKQLILCLLLAVSVFAQAQQTFTLTDTTPVTVNGLKAGYTITDESEKSAKKGDFSRYKIYFYLTNTGTESKIMYKRPGSNGHFGPISNIIALFRCKNATGARMTNKNASMELQPCRMEVVIEDKDPNSDKIIQTTHTANLGFWIRPGETVSKTYPMLVPPGERPQMEITFYPETANQTGALFENNSQPDQQQADYVRLRNANGNFYLHNQNGPLNCGGIDMNWWSAQWEMQQVNGNQFQIRNRWKNAYLSATALDGLSTDRNDNSTFWTVEDSGDGSSFIIRNAGNGNKLIFQNGQIRFSNSYINNDSAGKWFIEK